MKMRWIVLVVLLLVSAGVLEAQRAASDNVYVRAFSSEGGLSVVIDQPSPVIGCGQGVTLTATITGANGISWLRDGEYITGATTETFFANQSGVYSVVVVSLLCQLESAPVEVIILSSLNAQIQTPSGVAACEGDSVSLMASGAGSGSAVNWQWYRDGAIIPGAEQVVYHANQSGNYTVVGNEGSVCASTSAPVYVEINALPEVNLVWSGNSTICAGDSLNLIANTLDNQQISWYHDESLLVGQSANTLTVFVAGEYHATVVQTETGCEAITSAVYLDYFPQQTVTIVANGPTSICAGSQVQLSIDQGVGAIEWVRNGLPLVNTGELLLSVFESGVYIAEIMDANGCEEMSNSIEVIVDVLPDASLSIENDLPVLCGDDTLAINAAPGNAYVWMLGDSVLVGEEAELLLVTEPGNYSVGLTNTAGCVALSQSIEVVQYAEPNVVMEPSGDVNICAGQLQLLEVQAFAALSYTWFLDGIEFTSDFVNALEVSQGGVWNVVVTDENGCSAAGEPLYLTVLDVPTPMITAEAVTAEGQLLISDDASGHQWYLNGEMIPNATGAEYLATEDGIYSVISIEDVCESEVSAGFEVVIGIVASSTSNGIAIYPNPCIDQVRLMFGQGQGFAYRVYDASGSMVYSGIITQSQTTVDVQSWSAGIYSVVTEGGVCGVFTVVR